MPGSGGGVITAPSSAVTTAVVASSWTLMKSALTRRVAVSGSTSVGVAGNSSDWTPCEFGPS